MVGDIGNPPIMNHLSATPFGPIRIITVRIGANNWHRLCTTVEEGDCPRFRRAGRGDNGHSKGDRSMTEARKDLVIGVFEEEAQAEQAVSALWRAGFAPDRIDMANRRMGVVPGT